MINLLKSKLFGTGSFFINVEHVDGVIKCAVIKLPFIYFGFRLVRRCTGSKHGWFLLTSSSLTWHGEKAKILSIGGRLTLIKSFPMNINPY